MKRHKYLQIMEVAKAFAAAFPRDAAGFEKQEAYVEQQRKKAAAEWAQWEQAVGLPPSVNAPPDIDTEARRSSADVQRWLGYLGNALRRTDSPVYARSSSGLHHRIEHTAALTVALAGPGYITATDAKSLTATAMPWTGPKLYVRGIRLR